MPSAAIAWFRRDLRLTDNPMWDAARAGDTVVPLVVFEPGLLDAAGPYRRQAFLDAVDHLREHLAAAGHDLRTETGDPAEIVPTVTRSSGADSVHVNADVTRWARRRDERVADALRSTGGDLVAHWGTLVHRPGTVLTKAGTLSQVFTPFYNAWRALPIDDAPTDDAPSGELDPAIERAAQRADEYPTARDIPSIDGTSELSVALRFGTISPRAAARRLTAAGDGGAAIARQLAWRDWYAHLTFETPDIDRVALRPAYDAIPWETGPEADAAFAAWCEGRTGYPIVDAGIRQLRATGWMHNRVRMIVGSFLVKDLLIDWRRGERFFRHWLADGDIPQNAGNWQWVAGTGPDAAPYFRIFNPVTQSRKFDAAGDYIRRWVPELAEVDSRHLHAPWEAPPLEIATAGVTLGAEYPAPIVDHAAAREETLAVYKAALETARAESN
ncbi:MAG: deoxyribodipyrimidine photo-lyase [Actinomycetota bacterium]